MRKKVGIVAVALIAYPVIAHLSLLLGQRFVGVGFAAILAAAVLWTMRRKGPVVLVASAALAAVIVVAVATSRTEHLVYVPPVVITVLLAGVFGRSLGPGRTPLVTVFATIVRGDLDPRVARYTRRVTQLWTVVLVLLTVELVLLAVLAPVELWSLFANGINYVFVVVLFLAEYGFRRIYLADIPHTSFLQYIKAVRRMDLSSVVDRSKQDR